MKYTITGADRDTGEDVEMTIEAMSEEAARESASRKGVMVASCEAPIVRTAPRPVAEYRAPVQSGHVYGAPVINVALPRRGSSLGVASIVLGILAFLICWIPFVNIVSLPLSAIGLLLGVVGLFVAFGRQGSGVGLPIAGSLVCGLALLIAGVMNVAILGAAGAVSDAVHEAEARRAGTQPLTAPRPDTTKPAAAPGDALRREMEWANRVSKQATRSLDFKRMEIEYRSLEREAEAIAKRPGSDANTRLDAIEAKIKPLAERMDKLKAEYVAEREAIARDFPGKEQPGPLTP